MKHLALALGVALTMALAAAPAGAVSGGKKAPIASAPYIAWLPEGCTGTLIAPDRILTAGHCLSEFTPVGFSVLVGRDGNALVPFGANRFEGAIAHGGIPVRGFSVNPGFKESFPFAHRALQTGRMSVISSSACKRAYPHAIIASELCGQ